MNLADCLRHRRPEILERWFSQASNLPSAAGHSIVIVQNQIPHVVDLIFDALSSANEPNDLFTAVKQHIGERCELGYGLRDIVQEYHILRSVILDVCPNTPMVEVDPRGALLETLNLGKIMDLLVLYVVDHAVEDRDRARDLFIGILGHDLRAPLGTITFGAAALLKDEDLPQKHAKMAIRISSSALRMAKMISDLLDFARARMMAGGIPISREKLDLQVFLPAVVDEIIQAYPDRDIRFVPSSESFIGLWDKDRVSQAVSNLVGNAVYHGYDPIEISMEDREDQVAIVVKNQGVIQPGVVHMLFDPFAAARSDKRNGLGLGLYIVAEIVKAHRGSVEVESSNELGTQFRILLSKDDKEP